MNFDEAWDDTCSAVGLACRAGDAATLEALLKDAWPVDVPDNRGWRPIHEAACGGHLHCVRLLCEEDDNNVNWMTHSFETPLLLAARKGYPDLCRLLIEKGASLSIDLPETPLATAIKSGNGTCAMALIEEGYDIDYQDDDGYTPLLLAIEFQQHDVQSLLLERGVDIDKRDGYSRTAIFIAAEMSSLRSLSSMLDYLVFMKILSDMIDLPASDGTTPLMIAAQKGSIECVRTLLDHGANANIIANDCSMALHLAIFGKSVECLRLVLDRTDRGILRSVSWQPDCQLGQKRYSKKCMPCVCLACRGSDGSVGSQPPRPHHFKLSLSRNPFHIAVETGSAAIMQCLLDSDLDPNEFLVDVTRINGEEPEEISDLRRYRLMRFEAKNGATALATAARDKNLHMLSMLLNGGCRPEPSGARGFPALFFAMTFEWMDGIQLFLKRSYDLNRLLMVSDQRLLLAISFLFSSRLCDEIIMEFRRAGWNMHRIFCGLYQKSESRMISRMEEAMQQREDGLDLKSQLLDSVGFSLIDLLRKKGKHELANNLAGMYPLQSLKQMSAIVLRNAILYSRPSSAFLTSITSLELPPMIADYVALRWEKCTVG